MKDSIDHKLDLMARSLQEHINLARELKLNFVAQLLTMTAMEIKINLHRISDQEIERLCDSARRASGARPPPLKKTKFRANPSHRAKATAGSNCSAFGRFTDVIFCIKTCLR